MTLFYPYPKTKYRIAIKPAIVFLVLLFTQHLFAQPTISSFAPATGSAGTLVTITGTGFSATPSGNIVYFGAVKAVVITATATKLSVVVPGGATYEPISVTNAGLTGWSAKPFITVFKDGGIDFNSSSFSESRMTVGSEPIAVALSDFDGDGSADMATTVRYGNTISLYRNTSKNGNVSFSPKTDLTSGQVGGLATGDFNGDGKPDLVSVDEGSFTLNSWKNTSTPGNLSFSNTQFATGTVGGYEFAELKVADVDGDGRPDVISGNKIPGTVSVFRNTSTLTNISFATKIDYPAISGTSRLAVGDLDGDGKPELAVTTNGKITIYKNNSTPGHILFTDAGITFSFGTDGSPYDVGIADFDNDGKPDMAVMVVDYFNLQNNTVSIYPNTSNSGTLSFGPRTNFFAGRSGRVTDVFAISDLNFDGKPDIAVINGASYGVSVLKNTSSPGSFSFSNNVDFATGIGTYDIALGDLTSDGISDMVTVNADGSRSSISIFKNSFLPAAPKITSFSPTTAHSGDVITIKGSNFIPNTGVILGRSAPLSTSFVSDSTITVVAGANESGYVSVMHVGGSDSLPGFTFISDRPVINSLAPSIAGLGDTVIIKGKHFAGTSQVYFGNTLAASFSVTTDTTISAVVARGSSGYVKIVAVNGSDSLSGFTYVPIVPHISSFSPSSARQGDAITIKGTNFTGASSVTFGGMSAASFSLVSDTVITAVTGPGLTGNIVVTGPDGADSVSGFMYTGPIITSFSPAIAAKGTLVTIRGANFKNVFSVSLGGIMAKSVTILDDSVITVKLDTAASGAVKVITLQGLASLDGFAFVLPPVMNSFTPQMGEVGDTITISGQYFTYADSVLFGGAQATSFKVIDSATIRAVLGSGNTGDITVTSVGGRVSLPGFVVKTAPVITSFGPSAAAVGTTVNISGIRFGKTVADNTVYFGAVKAKIVAATTTSLTVQVPYGATYAPISVTTKNGTAYTDKQFVLTFKGGDTSLTQNSFAAKIDLTAVAQTGDGGIADITEDGKPDLITGGGNPTFMSTYKNSSASGVISFEAKQDFASSTGIVQIALSDLNADGKLDFSLGGSDDIYMGAVYQNTTANGNVSLKSALTLYSQVLGGQRIASGDIDNDGKPDLGCVGFYGAQVSLFRNTSTNDSVSFAPAYNWGIGKNGTGICFSDVDMDGKLDVIIGLTGSFTVFRNTGAKGVLSFAPGVNFPFLADYSNSGGVAAGDMDGDGKPDVAVAGGYLGVFKNTSKPGSISFSLQYLTATDGNPGRVSIGDLNGDGKPELIVCNKNSNSVSIFRNNSTPGNLSLVSKLDFAMGDSPQNVAVGDLDADGKPELVVFSSGKISIFKNQQMNAVPPPVISSFAPATGYTGATVTIKGTDFTGTKSVSFGGTAASSFAVLSDSVITAVVAAGNTGDVIVTTDFGADTLAGFTFVTPVVDIASFTPIAAANGAVVTIKGTGFRGVTDVEFGGIPASSFSIVSDTIITATVGAGTTGTVKVTAPYGADSLAGFTFIVPVVTPDITSFAPNIGTTGTVVTIKGTRLTGTTTVSFGGTIAASFTVVSDSVITATVGAGSSGVVSVITPKGNDTLSGFTFIPLVVTPDITSFAPSSGATGTVVTVKGIRFTGTSSISFGGTAAASFVVVSDSVVKATVGAGATGAVKLITPNGSDTLGVFSYIAPVVAPDITSFNPNTGTTGTLVTIKGIRLTGATTVSFGGTSASSFSVVSDSVITATVGTGATGTVKVITQNGTDTLNGFIYIAPVVTPDITSFAPASGTTGTVITIKGVRLTGATTVSFGGTSASSFTVVSDSVITATVGTGATGVINVVTKYGSDTLHGFTFIAPVVAPEIFSFTPSSGSGNALVTIKGKGFTGATAVSFGGTAAASFTVVSDTVITAVVGNGATGSVQISSPNGTASLNGFTYVSTNQQSITVAPNPAKGYVIVSHPASLNGHIKLISMEGNIVLNIPATPNASSTRIDLTGIKAGIYVISWNDGHDSLNQLVFVQ